MHDNTFGVQGIRAMVPILQNANNLTSLNVNNNYVQGEGFNVLWGALRESPIEELWCHGCGIESIEIDSDKIPKCLRILGLCNNDINADGCRELAKILHRESCALKTLDLQFNSIDDEGVGILANALQNNTSLESLDLYGNKGITMEGKKLLLKLLNDISSIKATLQSNHTLQGWLTFFNIDNDQFDKVIDEVEDEVIDEVEDEVIDEVETEIIEALQLNRMNKNNPEAAGREKVINTQLNTYTRAKMRPLQGVEQCNTAVYSQINPLHLPEVLALIGKIHGEGELFVALKSSIAALLSTVNKKEWLKQQIDSHSSKIKELESQLNMFQAELATMEEAEIEYRSTKRLRT